MTTQHSCVFPEVVIEETDEHGPLVAGMKVLKPCECGETPLDHVEFLDRHIKELEQALLAYEPWRPLYHWAPATRRKQIIRYGLRPGMRGTTSAGDGYSAPCVCFADSASWAWALTLSGRGHSGEWDLWQTAIDRLQEPIVLATDDRPTGLYEVRTENRVYKRDLWLAGSRMVSRALDA